MVYRAANGCVLMSLLPCHGEFDPLRLPGRSPGIGFRRERYFAAAAVSPNCSSNPRAEIQRSASGG